MPSESPQYDMRTSLGRLRSRIDLDVLRADARTLTGELPKLANLYDEDTAGTVSRVLQVCGALLAELESYDSVNPAPGTIGYFERLHGAQAFEPETVSELIATGRAFELQEPARSAFRAQGRIRPGSVRYGARPPVKSRRRGLYEFDVPPPVPSTAWPPRDFDG